MGKAALIFLVLTLTSALSFGGDEAKYKDGTYEGVHSFVTVSVTVKDGKIAGIVLARHGGGGAEYAAMVGPLIGKIMEKQSTDVDAVTGATVSSVNLKKAVEDALKKASLNE
ncbi:MAG: FMN-binding protein [Candidatus Omnitrophota bacterium]|nr:FMN-binding protein [Candidatus Omnitrophota bacterium]